MVALVHNRDTYLLTILAGIASDKLTGSLRKPSEVAAAAIMSSSYLPGIYGQKHWSNIGYSGKKASLYISDVLCMTFLDRARKLHSRTINQYVRFFKDLIKWLKTIDNHTIYVIPMEELKNILISYKKHCINLCIKPFWSEYKTVVQHAEATVSFLRKKMDELYLGGEIPSRSVHLTPWDLTNEQLIQLRHINIYENYLQTGEIGQEKLNKQRSLPHRIQKSPRRFKPKLFMSKWHKSMPIRTQVQSLRLKKKRGPIHKNSTKRLYVCRNCYNSKKACVWDPKLAENNQPQSSCDRCILHKREKTCKPWKNTL